MTLYEEMADIGLHKMVRWKICQNEALVFWGDNQNKVRRVILSNPQKNTLHIDDEQLLHLTNHFYGWTKDEILQFDFTWQHEYNQIQWDGYGVPWYPYKIWRVEQLIKRIVAINRVQIDRAALLQCLEVM